MLSGEGNENPEKTTVGLISKKINFARAGHFVFVHFWAVVLHDYNVNRLETSCMATLFMEEMSYMLLFTFLFAAAFFSSVAVSISHFLTAATNSCCSV